MHLTKEKGGDNWENFIILLIICKQESQESILKSWNQIKILNHVDKIQSSGTLGYRPIDYVMHALKFPSIYS